MADYTIDERVDITDVVCPMTFVKAKVAMDELEDGEVIEIRMNDGEPVQNVPRSIKEEGHQILKLHLFRQENIRVIMNTSHQKKGTNTGSSSLSLKIHRIPIRMCRQ